MAFAITIPRLGWSMEEGTFVGWQKKDGDAIRRGDILFELEGEKALQEIEALDEGVLRIPPNGPATGSVLKVGAVVGVLVAEGEAAPWETGTRLQPADGADPYCCPAAPPAGISGTPIAPSPASPSMRRLARELGVSPARIMGTGTNGRITEEDVRSAAFGRAASGGTAGMSEAGSGSFATPRARAAAKRLGVDWSALTGTGRNGRVREKDVLNSADRVATPSETRVSSRITLSGRRIVIADRLTESIRQTVPVTITMRADANNLVSLRKQFKAADQSAVPAYHDIIAKLVASCLQQQPILAGRRDGNDIVLPGEHDLHIGLAVDTPEGLIVPVLRDVLTQSLPTLAAESSRIIKRARGGRLSTKEMDGAVFTITSLGSFGIDAFTPVINSPETAILGLGAIRKEAIVTDDDRIVVGQTMTLSLTFDHRVIDGAPAARFLQSLVKAIENPAARLLGG